LHLKADFIVATRHKAVNNDPENHNQPSENPLKDTFQMTPWTRLIVASIAILASSNLWALSPVYTVQTGLGSLDIGDGTDSFYYLTGAALLSSEISSNSIFDLQAEISTYDYSDNDNIESEEIFLQGTFSYTPTAGFRVPTYSIGLRYLEEFASEDEFDASTLTLILSLSYRIDDRTNILGGFKLGDRDTDADIDSDITGYYVNLDFLYSSSLLFYSTLGVDEGAETIRSYCSGAYYSESGSLRRSRQHHDEVEDSGDSISGDCDNTYLALGANYSINSSNTLDLSVSFNDYDTPVVSFDGEIYSIDYFYRL
jgi:hypothetical protein